MANQRADVILQAPDRTLPNIQKMQDLKNFMNTEFYKEMKAIVGLPPTSEPPNDNFSLVQALRKREHGLASPGLHRTIANLYIPNKIKACILTLNSAVSFCKYDKTGEKLLTGCQNGTIAIYDSSKGTYNIKNRIKTRNIWSEVDADFSPCGQFFAYSTCNKSIVVMPVNGSMNDCVHIALKNDFDILPVFSLSYSPCGGKVIGGSIRSTFHVADIETKTAQYIRTAHYPVEDNIDAICYVTDNNPNVIVCGCDSGCIGLYDLRCDRIDNVADPQSLFYGHFHGITYLNSRNNGYHILSNSKDQSIKIWDLRKTARIFYGQHFESSYLNNDWYTMRQNFYNPKNRLQNDTSIMSYRGHQVNHSLMRAKFSPAQQTGQRYIYTGCATGRVIIYDVLTAEIREAIEGHTNLIRDLDWHPHRAEIVSGSWDAHIHLSAYKHNSRSRAQDEKNKM